ncbi:MAG: HEAT repeat domain-containing protein [Myxococcales bacterium]|nr:HEAT repeat domain-containing protein [Myxococcales bacterium]
MSALRDAGLLLALAGALSACRERPQPAAPSPTPVAKAMPSEKPAPAEVKPEAGDSAGLPEATDAQREAFADAEAALARGDEHAALAAWLRASEGPASGLAISAQLAAAARLESENRPAEARALYDKLLEGPGAQMAEVQFTAARAFAAGGDSARAIEGFRAALKLEADFLPAYPLLGALLVQAGKTELAAPLMFEYEKRIDALRKRLADPTAQLGDRLAVIDVFALIEDERATAALIEALKSDEPHLRLSAGDALANDAAPEALKALAEATMAEADPINKRALAASLHRAKARVEATLRTPLPALPKPQPAAPAQQ